MKQKILFSPIGGTDPIKYYRDGSMLHICRHYQPDLVYLYLSHEMMEYHKKDNRYVDTLEKLGRHLHHKFDIHIIERPELVAVQQYDTFYEDFRQEIKKIEDAMDDGDELLLNMASGTPAMKSALLVMATFAEYRFLPIQVSTPQKKMNKEYDNRENYEDDVDFALNEDNGPDAPNRCQEIKCLNLMRLIKIDAVKKHIRAYDYTAALSVAEEMKEELPLDAYRLLQIADARIKLNRQKISSLMKDKKYDIYPIQTSGHQKILEYALALQTKIAKQDYADFVRGITPLIVDLMEQILKQELGIALDDCCTKDKQGMRKWDAAKLKNNGLLDLLNEAYKNNGGFRIGPVYTSQLVKIIIHKSRDLTLCERVEEIAKIEGLVRNMAAHEIISVTDEWISKRTGKTAEQIFSLIKYLTRKAGIPVKDSSWTSYDKMNAQIEQFLI